MGTTFNKMPGSASVIGASLLAAIVAAACGGGSGGVAGVGSGGTGFVTGFGSVIIDGVKYEDSALDTSGRLTSEDGATDLATTRDRLKLGQRLEIEFENEAIRSAIIQSELVGPVTTASTNNASFAVAGQTVRINTDPALGPVTVLDGVTQLNDFAVGDRVEVHGDLTADGSAILASRIERKPAVDAAGNAMTAVKLSGLLRVAGNALTVGGIAIDRSSNPAITPSGVTLLDGQRVKVFGGAIQNNTLVATAIRVKAFKKSFADFRLRGVVSSVTGTTFVIYGITVDASAVTALPTITVGRAYWVRGVYTASADNANNGTLKASEVKTSSDDAVKMSELKGSITDYVSNASFRVRGVLVDASAVSGLSGLANGQFVEVKGSVVDGVVKAISVESKSAATGNELEITDVVAALNTNAKTFNLGSQAVNYASAVFEDGSASDLLDGKLLEVEGRLNGSTLVARKIEFKGSNGTATQSREDREVEGRLPVSATASGEIVSFSVNGVSLTCTQASVGAACRTSVLVRGAEVEVRYTGSAAPFTATRLKRED